MRWKLTIVVIMLILVTFFCYIAIDITPNTISIQQEYQNKTKIKMTPEEFNNYPVPGGYVAYYFYTTCPDYKEKYYIIEKEGSLNKYYLPEENYALIVKKDHEWTKVPNFAHHKKENIQY